MRLELSSRHQELIKWVALGLMAVDHATAAFLPWMSPAWLFGRHVGRLAWPMFAGLIAYNLVIRHVPVRRYLPWVAGLLVVSQPAAWLLRGHVELINIFGTIGGGLLITWAGRRLLGGRGSTRGGVVELALALGALAGGLFLGAVSEYGLAGVLLIPVWVLAFERPGGWTFAGLMVALLAQNWGGLGPWVALLVPGLMAGLATVGRGIQRTPRWVGWAFYPVHLAVLGVVSRVFLFGA